MSPACIAQFLELAMFFSTSALANARLGSTRSASPRRNHAGRWKCLEIRIDVSLLNRPQSDRAVITASIRSLATPGARYGRNRNFCACPFAAGATGVVGVSSRHGVLQRQRAVQPVHA